MLSFLTNSKVICIQNNSFKTTFFSINNCLTYKCIFYSCFHYSQKLRTRASRANFMKAQSKDSLMW